MKIRDLIENSRHRFSLVVICSQIHSQWWLYIHYLTYIDINSKYLAKQWLYWRHTTLPLPSCCHLSLPPSLSLSIFVLCVSCLMKHRITVWKLSFNKDEYSLLWVNYPRLLWLLFSLMCYTFFRFLSGDLLLCKGELEEKIIYVWSGKVLKVRNLN